MQNLKKNKKNWIWHTLILMHGLSISQSAKFTSKNITQQLLGSRNSYNVFKYENLKHILLKLTPFIGTVFASHLKLKTQISHKFRLIPPIPPKDPSKLSSWKKKIRGKKLVFRKRAYFYETAKKKKPIRILFATTTPVYSTIIQKAAQLCQMPFYNKRWWNGYLTANFITVKPFKKKQKKIVSNKIGVDVNLEFSKVEPRKLWKKLLPIDLRNNSVQLWNDFHYNYNNKKKFRNVTPENFFEKKFQTNKEQFEKYYAWHSLLLKAKRPALLIIPDIQSNVMILKETNSLQIPIIGLVDSTCSLKIDYPIFGNSTSIKIVHFFSNLVATIIAKEFIEQTFKNKSHKIFSKKLWLSSVWSKRKVQTWSLKKTRHLVITKKKSKLFRFNMYLNLCQKKKKIFYKNRFKFLFNTYQNFKIKKKINFKLKNRIWKKRFIKMRKRFNIHLPNIVWPKHNIKILTQDYFFDQMDSDKVYFSNSILRSILQIQKKTNKKKINSFFLRYFYLNFLIRNFRKKYLNKQLLQSDKLFFFERSLYKKYKNTPPFFWKLIEQELKLTTGLAWTNNYWTFFWNTKKNLKKFNKKKKAWWWKASLKFKTRLRKKIKFSRINQPFRWLLNKQFFLKNKIRRMTIFWLKTRLISNLVTETITEFKTLDTFWHKRLHKRFWLKNNIILSDYLYLKKKPSFRKHLRFWKYKYRNKYKKNFKNFLNKNKQRINHNINSKKNLK